MSNQYLHNLPHIRASLDHLRKNDPVFSKLDIAVEKFSWRHSEPGFPALARIVIGQQLSTRAAATVWEKFERAIGDVTPSRILTLSDEDLRALGLSRQKTSYIRGLAQAVHDGALDIAAFGEMNDDDVSSAITGLKGLGPWSAQMFLMFCLARLDIWPAGDLGIQEGLKTYLGRKERPTFEETQKTGKRFAPHRTAASLLLWRIKDAKA